MKRPLLWKELRESRLALIIGCFWVIGAFQFWLSWAQVRVPLAVDIVLVPSAMFASGICMVALGAVRFAGERHSGAWEFLRVQPVSLRHLVAVKWATTLGLTALLMSLSSALAWYPLIRLSPHLEHMTLAHFVCMHVSAAALFVSLLLMVDTMDWGAWLGTRTVVTAALVVPFVWTVNQGYNVRWPATIAYGLLAVALGCAAVWGAPWLAGESPLPVARIGRTVRRQFSKPFAAWWWREWRQVRFVTALLMLPVPVMVAVLALPGILDADSNLGRAAILEWALARVHGFTAPLMCIAGGLLGWMIPIVGAQGGGEAFLRTLPVPTAQVQRWRLAFVHALLVIVFLPVLLAAVIRVGWLGQAPMVAAAALAVQFALSSAVCCVMLTTAAYSAAVHLWIGGMAAAPLVFMVTIWLIGRLLDLPLERIPVVTLGAAGVVAAAALLVLKAIDSRREFA